MIDQVQTKQETYIYNKKKNYKRKLEIDCNKIKNDLCDKHAVSGF